MQLLMLQGKAAMTYNGTWLLRTAPGGRADRCRSTCTWRRCPWSMPAPKAHSIVSWAGFALPADARRQP